MKTFKYPKKITETFDNANFHIKYCLYFIKPCIKGDVLEVGAGCGSFTRNYINNKVRSLLLTDKDFKNLSILKKKFKSDSKVLVSDKSIFKIKKKFDTILYIHILEHIKNDKLELKQAINKLKKGGYLIIIVPAHKKIYSGLDKTVGHYRRYDLNFFKKKIGLVELKDLKFLDSMGYVLYYLNRIFFTEEKYPSKFKIFIWDKIFTPLSAIFDFATRYKFGKAILAIYKK